MKLPGEFLSTYLPELIEQNVKVEMIGNFDILPEHTKKAIQQAMEATAENDGMTLNFAMNYGSRLELIECVKEIAKLVAEGEIESKTLMNRLLNLI